MDRSYAKKCQACQPFRMKPARLVRRAQDNSVFTSTLLLWASRTNWRRPSSQDRPVTQPLTNPSADSAMNVRIQVSGGIVVVEAKGTLLTHSKLAAANSFGQPGNGSPTTLTVNVAGELWR